MEKRKVLCIGGASGMGRGIAEASLEAGASVIVTSRTVEKAEKAAQDIGCEGLPVDLTNSESVSRLFAQAGDIDHLAITAGAVGRASFRDTPPEEAHEFMDAKLWATHACLLKGKEHLANDGSITLITGGYAAAATDNAGHVHIAFNAVEAMARVVAVSFAPIRCNVIRPGFIDSALWDYMDDDERTALQDSERAKTLTGEIVSPLAFGRSVVGIMMARAITGAIIPVDGGRHLWSGD